MNHRRSFRHLNSDEIQQMIKMFAIEGKPKLHIAEFFKVDNSTVHYHIRRYEESVRDIESDDLYSIIKVGVGEECSHPSLVCGVCGKRHDNLKSLQNLKILALNNKISAYQRRYGNI